ncbi:MAG: carbohydrate ABC transporter permease [Christensenellales bacterium]|jgi:raffinose/stachyose/melibiose transport system permease protein
MQKPKKKGLFQLDLTPLQRRSLPYVYLFLLPTLVIFFVFYLQPIATVFYTGFTSWNGFNAPEFTGMRNYARLFSREAFLIALKNLFLWTLIAVTVHVAIGALVGFLFYHKYSGWKVVRGLYMIPNVISGAAWAMIYKFVFNDEYGLLNNTIRLVYPSFSVRWFYSSPAAFWAVVFTWVFYAVIVSLIVLSDLMAIPQELHEAAFIDGAKPYQVTWYIDLPMTRVALGTGVICSATARISMYESIALTTRGGPGNDTMSLSIMLVNSITDMNYGMANAIGTIMFIIGILMLVVIRKAFRMNEPIY